MARSGNQKPRSGILDLGFCHLLAPERVTGIEPALSAWEADVLPLNYTRALPVSRQRRRAEPIRGPPPTSGRRAAPTGRSCRCADTRRSSSWWLPDACSPSTVSFGRAREVETRRRRHADHGGCCAVRGLTLEMMPDASKTESGRFAPEVLGQFSTKGTPRTGQL